MKSKSENDFFGIYTLNLFSMLKMCMIFFMVLLNIIGMENFSFTILKGHIAKFEVYTDDLNRKYIDKGEVQKLKQREEVQEVYCQRFCREIKCIPDQKNRYYTSLHIYNDSLFKKMMELNGITGLDVQKDEIGIVISFDNKEYQCRDMTLENTSRNAYGKKCKIPVNIILYDADQTGLLGGYYNQTYERAYLIVNEKLAKKIAPKLGNKNLLNSYTDVLVDCNSLLSKGKLQSLLTNAIVTELEAQYQETFIRNIKKMIQGILILILLASFFIIYRIILTNFTEEESGMERSAEEIKNTGKEIMRMAGNTFLAVCKVAVPISLAVNFFFRYDKFRLVVTGYWVGALIMLGDCFIMTCIAVKRALHKRS